MGTVAHEDGENDFLLKEEPDRHNLIIKEDVDSCRISEEQESHPAVDLREEVSFVCLFLRAIEHFVVCGISLEKAEPNTNTKCVLIFIVSSYTQTPLALLFQYF